MMTPCDDNDAACIPGIPWPSLSLWLTVVATDLSFVFLHVAYCTEEHLFMAFGDTLRHFVVFTGYGLKLLPSLRFILGLVSHGSRNVWFYHNMWRLIG